MMSRRTSIRIQTSFSELGRQIRTTRHDTGRISLSGTSNETLDRTTFSAADDRTQQNLRAPITVSGARVIWIRERMKFRFFGDTPMASASVTHDRYYNYLLSSFRRRI